MEIDRMVFRIKQILVAILYRVDQWFPLWFRVLVRNRCWPWKLVLDAVELHVVDRCNMNCTACSHFSPFAAEWQADARQLAEDLATLKAKFRGGIRHVNLLGGEPLLHADACDVMARVRGACPGARITLVTNGVLLLGQPASFWETCRKARIRLNLTLYGPMATKRSAIEARCASEGVPLRVQEGNVFFARMVPDGTADAKRAFKFCRKVTYCPYLREGRLYTCAQAYHIRDFVREVRRVGGVIADVADDGLDIYREEVSGRQILDYLMTPSNVCRYCADSTRLMTWSNGSRDVRDWFRVEKANGAFARKT